MIERHFHWRFTCWNGETDDKGMVKFPVSVEVIGYENEADATIAAQDVIKREHYQIGWVMECQSCGFQRENSDALKAMVKAMQ